MFVGSQHLHPSLTFNCAGVTENDSILKVSFKPHKYISEWVGKTKGKKRSSLLSVMRVTKKKVFLYQHHGPVSYNFLQP